MHYKKNIRDQAHELYFRFFQILTYSYEPQKKCYLLAYSVPTSLDTLSFPHFLLMYWLHWLFLHPERK